MAAHASPLRLLAVSALFWLPGVASQGHDCPDLESQYTPEPNPFGWPMSPAFPKDVMCWHQYPTCFGKRQAPLNIPMHPPEGQQCVDVFEEHSGENWRQKYFFYSPMMTLPKGQERAKVKVSSYMRSVMVEGNFGEVKFKNTKGEDVMYEATQVHLIAPSMHTHGWWQAWDAELLVVHKPKGAADMVDGSVIFSLLLEEEDPEGHGHEHGHGHSGPPNPIFEKLGISGGHHAPHGPEWEVDPFGLQDVMNKGLEGVTVTYNGSLPMPPCSETVTWIVAPMSGDQVPAAQIQQLKDVLKASAKDGVVDTRIPSTPRAAHEECRKFIINSREVSHNHHDATCEAYQMGGAAPAACWDSMSTCSHAPAIITSDSVIEEAKLEIKDLVQYNSHQHMEMKPSSYTLDGTVAHGGSFGHIMLHGRRFEATKLSVKPIGAHVIDGQRFAGEIIIEHTLYGDLHGAGDHTPGGHGTGGHGAGGHGAGDHAESSGGHGHGHGRRLEDSSVEEAHKVMVSVPLKLGKESALLRQIGLPNPAFTLAMRDGNAFETEVDLSGELQPFIQGNWFWYSSKEVQPGCSAWGARWIVLQEPLEVSLEQLDALALKFSGFDSTPKGVSGVQIWKNSVPKHGVETAGHNDCSGDWSHANTACWGLVSSTCTAGHAQSPINIKSSSVSKEGGDSFLAKCSWKPLQGLEVTKTELGLQVQSNQLGYIAFVGDLGDQDYYQVTDLVLHMPSEHMIDGQQFDAELQVVHKRQQTVHIFEDGNQIIASFLFKIGNKENPLLKQLLLPGDETEIKQPVDLMRALGPVIDAGFYRYDGSLTAPSCGEVVKWFVFDSPMEMSRDQWAAFKTHFPTGNSRPVQELHGRPVVRNSFEEGTIDQQGFYLNRKTERDRSDWGRDKNIILIPVLFSLVFSIYIMASLFVREDRDRKAQSNGGLAPAGLEQTIGKPQYSRF